MSAQPMNIVNLNLTTATYGKPPVFEFAFFLICLACLAQGLGA
jgi:hypothetical protein